MANQIMLKGDYRREEAIAAAGITPGHLLELDSASKVKVHATEGDYAERAFAVEDALQGNTITDAYSAADLVSYNLVEPGAEVQAFLKAGENVAVGAVLISAGDGSLIAEASAASGTTVKQAIAVATEALNLSASGAVAALVNVRVL